MKQRTRPDAVDREECLQIVRFAIALHADIPPDAIAPRHGLSSDLGLAPLDLVQVALFLEELGETEFPIADLEGAESVEDFAEVVLAWCDEDVSEHRTAGPPHEQSPGRVF